ncbi:hypothetical protein BB560_000304 [Smittium megazygosporum]|uniref:Uncharacterized protein n=1 Tax=Smittium megazygosporum TaxID=133381 RepID=A0A2T9ZKR1_9FUNG|nr:hypothetical protein BB560_000304 [Smittium megazygosporum]
MSLSKKSKIASRFLDQAKNMSFGDTQSLINYTFLRSDKGKLLFKNMESNLQTKSSEKIKNIKHTYSKIIEKTFPSSKTVKENNGIVRKYYNYFSENLTHDSFYVINCLKDFLNGHFGVLSRLFRDTEKQQDILSIEDPVTCFEQKSSQNRSTRGLRANADAYKFYIYSKDMPRVDRHQIKIDGGVKLNLSYYFVNEKLFASTICSEDLSLYNPLAYKIAKAKDTRKDKYAPDQIQRMNAGDALMGPSSIRIQMKRVEMLGGWRGSGEGERFLSNGGHCER